MQKHIITEGWMRYVRDVITPEANQLSINDQKIAYYCGIAHVMGQLQQSIMAEDDLAYINTFNAIQDDLSDFVQKNPDEGKDTIL